VGFTSNWVFAQMNFHIFVVISKAYGMWPDGIKNLAVMLFGKKLTGIMSILEKFIWNCIWIPCCLDLGHKRIGCGRGLILVFSLKSVKRHNC